MKNNILFAILLLPFLCAFCIEVIGGLLRANAKITGLTAVVFSISLLLCSALLCCGEYGVLLSGVGKISYELKLDYYAAIFILLTSFIVMLCVIESAAGKTIAALHHYIALFFTLQGILNLFFCANGIILFYILFEASLIPVFFIIGLWGGKDRIAATIKFFLYTFAGSIGMLIASLYLNALSVRATGYGLNFDSMSALIASLDNDRAELLWVAIFVALAVKVPIIPLHTWLPRAHVQAPTAGSMILAGVLLKMGGYGMFKILLGGFADISVKYSSFVIILSIISVIYGSFIALVQKDIKSLIAYSSIAHMGFVTAGLFSNSKDGVSGAIFQMISHGIISAGLFAIVGMFYRRSNSMALGAYRGLASTMPVFAIFFVILSMSAMAVPGTSGFIGEVMVIFGLIAERKILYGAILSFSVVLSALYMLKLLRNVIWGESNGITMSDLSCSERSILAVTVVAILYLGLYSSVLIDRM